MDFGQIQVTAKLNYHITFLQGTQMVGQRKKKSFETIPPEKLDAVNAEISRTEKLRKGKMAQIKP